VVIIVGNGAIGPGVIHEAVAAIDRAVIAAAATLVSRRGE
jgi:hypothetical protein